MTRLLTPTHLAILLVVVLLIFGPKRLPQAGRALGQSLREFKDGVTGGGKPQTHPPPEAALVCTRRNADPDLDRWQMVDRVAP